MGSTILTVDLQHLSFLEDLFSILSTSQEAILWQMGSTAKFTVSKVFLLHISGAKSKVYTIYLAVSYSTHGCIIS